MIDPCACSGTIVRLQRNMRNKATLDTGTIGKGVVPIRQCCDRRNRRDAVATSEGEKMSLEEPYKGTNPNSSRPSRKPFRNETKQPSIAPTRRKQRNAERAVVQRAERQRNLRQPRKAGDREQAEGAGAKHFELGRRCLEFRRNAGGRRQ